MKLTGKSKISFEKWYFKYCEDLELYPNGTNKRHIMLMFYELTQSMQYGVYVDFFDSVGIMLSMENYYNTKSDIYYEVGWTTISRGWNTMNDMQFKTRQEARTKAIEKANKIYNETR
jgi:hypothetical protein